MPEDELYKEPAFFSHRAEHRGMEWYLNLFAAAREEQTFVGEASTAYLTDPVSAKRIYDYNPSAKIIILLRNPAARAYSLYNWMVQDGYEFAASFEDALQLEEERAKKTIPNWFEPEYYWNYLYFKSGLYSEQVQRYMELFGENVLILKFEDFTRNTAISMNRVYKFLNLPEIDANYEAHNISKTVISPRLQFVLRKFVWEIIRLSKNSTSYRHVESGISNYYRECLEKLSTVADFTIKERVLGRYILWRIFLLLRKNVLAFKEVETKEQRDRILDFGLIKSKPAKMNLETRKILLTKYESDIARLGRLTELDFSQWIRT